MTRRSIQNEWDKYRTLAIPGDANYEQRRALRRTFYAGALVVLSMIREYATDEDLDVDEGERLFAGWEEEIHAYYLLLQNDKDPA